MLGLGPGARLKKDAGDIVLNFNVGDTLIAQTVRMSRSRSTKPHNFTVAGPDIGLNLDEASGGPSYADYERRIGEQMVRLFGGSGFDPKKDIAGIILNRWGHAYVDPQPGFYFPKDGSPAPSDVIRRRHGRISFAHSDLGGHQYWLGAINEGRRAVGQILEVL